MFVISAFIQNFSSFEQIAWLYSTGNKNNRYKSAGKENAAISKWNFEKWDISALAFVYKTVLTVVNFKNSQLEFVCNDRIEQTPNSVSGVRIGGHFILPGPRAVARVTEIALFPK